jgi:hypothetical protein
LQLRLLDVVQVKVQVTERVDELPHEARSLAGGVR